MDGIGLLDAQQELTAKKVKSAVRHIFILGRLYLLLTRHFLEAVQSPLSLYSKINGHEVSGCPFQPESKADDLSIALLQAFDGNQIAPEAFVQRPVRAALAGIAGTNPPPMQSGQEMTRIQGDR